VPALGNEKLSGKLIYVGQTINPETRTVLVRTELDNSDGRLKPAMLASMLIEAKPVERWWCRPARWCARTTRIMSSSRKGWRFPSGQVKLGPEQGGLRVVLSGLKGQRRWSLTALST
jgi:cobalt-zinc-cadmium efflux system membrane fusion protein